MTQREFEELAREMERTCGHGTGPRIELCPTCFAEVIQRAVESAVEKACKAVCAGCRNNKPLNSSGRRHVWQTELGNSVSWVCKARPIRRAFSPASPAEEKRQP